MNPKSLSKIQKDFSLRFAKAKREVDPQFAARYVGAVGHEDRAPDEQSKLVYLGLKTPVLDRTFKMWCREQEFSDSEWVEVLDHLYFKATTFEERSACLSWWDDPKKIDLSVEQAKLFCAWVDGIDNWANSDQFSNILARILERAPEVMRPILTRWNRSKKPWERRQSIVALLYYSRMRKRLPDRKWTLAQIEALVEDPHFYVQRGVGWALREFYNAWPEHQVAWVRKHLHEISGTAWFATSEKYPPKLKKEFVALRKERRQARAGR